MGTGRLRRRQDFERVFDAGRSVANRLVVLRVARRDGGDTRVGIAVGRQLGGAVVRNRLRRRWREVVRLGPVPARGWDLVLVARGAGRRADGRTLAYAWCDVLRRGGVLDGPTP